MTVWFSSSVSYLFTLLICLYNIEKIQHQQKLYFRGRHHMNNRIVIVVLRRRLPLRKQILLWHYPVNEHVSLWRPTFLERKVLSSPYLLSLLDRFGIGVLTFTGTLRLGHQVVWLRVRFVLKVDKNIYSKVTFCPWKETNI